MGLGTYNEENCLSEQRAEFAWRLQSISLEIGLLAPGLPSLANAHQHNAHVKDLESAHLVVQAHDAWWYSTKHWLLCEASWSGAKAVSHREAANQLHMVQGALQAMYMELTSGSVYAHMHSHAVVEVKACGITG